MRATGIVRKLDNLGRVVLPVGVRNELGINIKDPLEMFVTDNGMIVLEKYTPKCVFCNGIENVEDTLNKPICKSCLEELKKI